MTCTATDDAGNIAQDDFVVTVVDTTPPTGTILVNGGATYSTAAAVVLTLACNDAATGCSDMQFSQDGTNYSAFEPFAGSKNITLGGGDGNKTVYVKFRDGASNVSLAFSDTIVLDTTPPSITLVAPAQSASYALNQVVASNYSCSDVTSGVATCAGPVASGANFDSSTVGSHNFTVNASDQAGNTATTTHTYGIQYVFNGFFNPVVNNGVWNVVNAGRAIPLKWTLTDATGNFVLDLATVQSIYYAQVPCSYGESVPVPLEGDADYTGNSDLRIAGTEYHFNWRTLKNFANKCFPICASRWTTARRRTSRNSSSPSSASRGGVADSATPPTRHLRPSTPASSFAAVGFGGNTIWIDPEHDLVVVWRWHQGNGAEFFARVVAALR